MYYFAKNRPCETAGRLSAAAPDAAGTPIRLDEHTDPYLLHLIGLSAGDLVHALSAEAPDLKDGVYTVSVIIERVRPLDFVLN